MKRIPLRNRAGAVVAHALVDDADYAWAMRWRWSLANGYVRRGTFVDGVQRHHLLHRELLGLKHGDRRDVDHRNGDHLDNQRANLRIGTRSQNLQNRHSVRGRSRHRNVWFDKRRSRWVVEAKLNYRKVYIGSFETEEAAGAAAAAWRRDNMPFSQEAAP